MENLSVEVGELKKVSAEVLRGLREVREMFKETDKKFAETDKKFAETDKKFQETDKKFAETAKRFRETDKKFAETAKRFRETDKKFAETDRRFKETDKKFQEMREERRAASREADERLKRLGARIQRAFDLFETQWGKLMESLVDGDLVPILNERGIKVESTSTRRKGMRNGKHYEFDIIAHNGEEIVVVEVKTTLRVKDVKKHIKRLEEIHHLLPEFKGFKVYGAVAFLRAEEDSEIFAEKQQLFVIRATGDSAAVLNDKGFRPRVF